MDRDQLVQKWLDVGVLYIDGTGPGQIHSGLAEKHWSRHVPVRAGHPASSLT